MSSRRHRSDRHRSSRHSSSRHSSNRPNDEPIAGPSNEASNEVSHWPPDRYIDPETFSDSITNRPGGIAENDPFGTGYDTIFNDPRFYPARDTHMQQSAQQAAASGRSLDSQYFTDERLMGGFVDRQQPVTYQPQYVSVEDSQAGINRMRANLHQETAELRNTQALASMQQGYYSSQAQPSASMQQGYYSSQAQPSASMQQEYHPSQNPPAEASGSGLGGVTNDPNAWYCNDCGKALAWCHLKCNSCDKRSGPRPNDRKCIKCAAPTEEKAVFCPDHMNAFRGLLTFEQKERLGEDGACKECWRYERPENLSKCSRCREKHAQWERENSKKRFDERNSQGLCGTCKQKFTQNDINMHREGKPRNCQKCVKKFNAKDKRVRENRKRR
ncbi:hypothetical protein NW768_002518 [Fusarium equiseti]|uniref:Uncharacterized protein n=1 Tax=Fusarium equiseti TaxID=61235 RepID=A0ABQ8RNL0_FUSEQ|nr:hypothetical protein NW768_002518 [Fusarium equiseti]